MKRMNWLFVVVVMALVFGVGAFAMAADAAKDAPKSVTGKSSCGGCAGVSKGCCVMLTDKDGGRWILRGDSQSLKAAFKGRSQGQTMTATLAGKPTIKKDGEGKEYKEAKVSDVKVKS